MKKSYLSLSLLSLMLLGIGKAWAAPAFPQNGETPPITIRMQENGSGVVTDSDGIALMTIYGTNASEQFVVSTTNLISDVKLSATAGFTVSPATIKAGSQDVTVTVTSTTTLARNTGKVILRSGDKRTYVRVTSLGTPLERRDLSQNPVYTGTDDSKSFEGFSPTDKGYTLEFRARTDDATKFVYPYAVTGAGTGFRGYVASEGMGLYNSATQKGLSNPSNGGTFYNTDGLYHTYRYAVTPDRRVFVYRDGIAVDTVRTSDLALPDDFCTESGDVVANLIKNPGFEGEWNRRPADNLTYRIEGWDVSPLDQYNSTQSVVGEERSNDVDQDNHVLEVNRYKWSAGWGAAEISQTVDVAPNEVYSFSALAKGGIKSDGTQLASLRIQDLQDSNNKATIPITGDSYQKYAADFTTSATCKQIRIVCYLERDKWGASISDFRIDDVKLTGVSRRAKAQIGFTKNFADLAYFTYDATGAYAPLESILTASADTLLIDGTGKSGTFTVSGENLTGPISVTATAGFTASPSKLDAGSQDVTVTVTSTTTLARNTGKVILRSGDKRTYVKVTSLGTPLERRDLSQNPVYTGTDDSKSFEGFSPTDKGYTLEFRARTDDATKFVYPYAVTGAGTGFRGYVASEGMGLYNSATQKGLSNPSNGGTFYNTDGLYHTYRYAVTPDRRVFVYRDGIAVDTVRTSDLALPEDFCTENGDVVANLIKNPGFEGEWNRRPADNLTYRIEGWDVSPLDQYNSTQSVVGEERSNDVDQDNHVLEVNRYKWSAGWGAAEISQTVDVAPNEVYSFSALAKGGIKSDGTQLASLRIQDLQDSNNKATIPITGDSYQKYAADFTTSATCKQIRIVCYLERDKWGASISDFRIDDVKLTGVSRRAKAQIGFTKNFADLAYFTYDATGAYAPLESILTASADTLLIDGTGKSGTFTVSGENLTGPISVTATAGFTASPSKLDAGSQDVTVTVTSTTTLARNTGKVILRSGDKRTYVKVTSLGTPLERRDLSQNPVYTGTDDSKSFEGFSPTDKGYTLEFRARTDDATKFVYPYAVTGAGTGFRGYVASEGMGLYNSATQKGLSNPSNGGTFYNTDGLYHTYRYAVTPDRRVFVYRDGIAVDTVRTSDLALPEDFCTENGDVVANLIKNPGFEGEWNRRPADNLTYRIEGWDVSPLDQYNSTQSVVGEERSNDVDQDNHVLEVNRYKWSAGWGAAEISQTVDVAPNEVYSFSALAKGGIKSDGTQLASLRIQDLQDSNNKATIPITGDSYQKYAADFTTSATCKQIRIVCYLERDKWGASISDFRIDDVKLTGVSRRAKAQIGFTKNFADLAYFTYDTTGAYAPLESSLTASADTLLIDGTGKSGTFTVSGENLTGPISVTATAGFTASPSKLDAGSQDVTVTVTSTTTLARNTGKVILRSGDKRTYVKVTSLGTPLERRDLSQNPVYTGTDDSKSFEGFSPTDKGYTLEFRARTDDATKFVYPYAVTGAGTGFRGYVASEGMGLYNSATQKGLSNPSNGGTFYNTDGLYHTYRYAVTPDRRVFVYRDGIAVDTVRTSDLALPEDFCTENGDVVANLIKNPGFEGEWNRRPVDNLTYRIEGWDVSPLDQYNSTQSIVGEERSNDVDQDNHVLEVNRYKWSAGWGAAEISQTVDVAPNEVYSFSALAKGGIKSDGTQLASLRIQDLQDSNNKATIPITGDSYQKYAADFTTSATCKQIRIVCYLERDKWGASISDFRIDDVKLTGVSRRAKAQIGFTKNFADLAYFTYDTTGAYAPLESSLTVSNVTKTTGIETVGTSESMVKAFGKVMGGRLFVSNMPDNASLSVYSITGSLLARADSFTAAAGIPLPAKGIYICVVTDKKGRQAFKIKY